MLVDIVLACAPLVVMVPAVITLLTSHVSYTPKGGLQKRLLGSLSLAEKLPAGIVGSAQIARDIGRQTLHIAFVTQYPHRAREIRDIALIGIGLVAALAVYYVQLWSDAPLLYLLALLALAVIAALWLEWAVVTGRRQLCAKRRACLRTVRTLWRSGESGPPAHRTGPEGAGANGRDSVRARRMSATPTTTDRCRPWRPSIRFWLKPIRTVPGASCAHDRLSGPCRGGIRLVAPASARTVLQMAAGLSRRPRAPPRCAGGEDRRVPRDRMAHCSLPQRTRPSDLHGARDPLLRWSGNGTSPGAPTPPVVPSSAAGL